MRGAIRPRIFDGMTATEHTSVPRVADREKLSLLLDKARQFETRFASRARSSLPLRLYLLSRKSLSSIAGEYIDSLEERPVFPGEKSLRAMDALIEPLPENP
jgi:hypothetical protein